jgi:hypothetical protein
MYNRRNNRQKSVALSEQVFADALNKNCFRERTLSLGSMLKNDAQQGETDPF